MKRAIVASHHTETSAIELREQGAGSRDFVALLSEEDRAALERLGRRISASADTALIHEGLHAEGVMVMLDGLVKVSCVTRSGRESILGFCRPGELIGELAAIDQQPHATTVVTIGPVEALVISSRDFRAFLEARPGVAIALLRMLSERFRDADRKLVEFGAADALGRVSSRLLELSATYGEVSGDGVTIALHLSQEELAGWAGCSTKAVVNALQTLRRLGLIETGRRHVTILDPDGLRSRAP
jgi:CRP/FNR family transcriptional regulator, cyclic AMP receptor protein